MALSKTGPQSSLSGGALANSINKIPTANLALAGIAGGAKSTNSLSSLAKATASSAAKSVAGGLSQAGKPYHCKEGWDLVWDADGNHVCRNRSTGATDRVIPNSSASSGGSSGGGGGSTASGGAAAGSNGTDYLSGPGADIFANNPQAMAADMLEQKYPNTNQGLGLLQMLNPYADAMNVLFLAQNGQSAEGGTKEDYLKFLQDEWTTLMTPGASLGDPAELWNNVLNPAQNSPLVSYLAVQDPEQQARNFRGVAAGIAGKYYHPLFADALMDNLGYRQDAFLGANAKGATDPFYQWIGEQMPYLSRLMPGG